MSFKALRIDPDPTTWELEHAVESKLDVPIDLEVRHPFNGILLLSPQAARSIVVFREHANATRPNGVAIGGGGALYVPSPHGPDVHSNPPNFYYLSGAADLKATGEVEKDLKELAGRILAAMTAKTSLPPVHFVEGEEEGELVEGEVVINVAQVPFVVVCRPTIKWR